MKKHYIGVGEAVSLGVIFLITKIFLPFPRTISVLGGTAAWMIVLIAAFFCPLSWWAIRGVMKAAKKDSTIITATEEIMGSIVGTIINLSYFSFFLMLTFIVLREFSDMIVTDILPRTPISIVILVLLIPSAVLARSGIEVLGRISWLTIGIIVVSLIILLLGGIMTYSDPNALTPIWGTGIAKVAKWGIIRSSLFSELLVFGFIFPRMRKEKDCSKAVWLCMVISSLILICSIITYLYVFPYPTATRINFPMLEVSRIIIAGRWIQRVEGLFLIIWLLCTIIKISIGIYCSASTLKTIFGLTKQDVVIFPLTMIIYHLSLLPANETLAVNWDSNIVRVYGAIFSIVLPLLTWIVGSIRKKRGQQL